jgi:hypothetical protein
MSLLPLFQWYGNTQLGLGVRGSTWLFPVIETAHGLGIILLAGTISVVDLRLLGHGMRRQPVSQVAGQLLPWTWAGFAVMAMSGLLLLGAEAVKVYPNPFFRIKMALLALAGLNALIFHFTIYRNVASWDESPATPVRAKLAGGFSLTLWIGIIAAGRAIAYAT